MRDDYEALEELLRYNFGGRCGPETVNYEKPFCQYIIRRYDDRRGSRRYALSIDGHAIAALQIIDPIDLPQELRTLHGDRPIAVNVYTAAPYRRKGLASLLLDVARKHYPTLIISPHQSPAGYSWIKGYVSKRPHEII